MKGWYARQGDIFGLRVLPDRYKIIGHDDSAWDVKGLMLREDVTANDMYLFVRYANMGFEVTFDPAILSVKQL